MMSHRLFASSTVALLTPTTAGSSVSACPFRCVNQSHGRYRIAAQPDIDGFLVGGASLAANKFAPIINVNVNVEANVNAEAESTTPA
jgi:Triosephosphate isomerase